MTMRRVTVPKGCAAPVLVLIACWVPSDVAGQANRDADGRYYAETGEPTYHIAQDGRVDWYTFNGYRRYHAECHMCHGPGGEGSTFAPPLLAALKAMNYTTFRDIIIHGLRTVGPSQQQVMRAMGQDRNVMCYLPDIYVYLKARADGALGRLRPEDHQPKPAAATQLETACLGSQ
jgi:methanol metabolism-related c-type cytochrome